MKNNVSFVKRSIILLSILVLPSVAYLFLRTGKNNFKHLGYFGPRDVSVNSKDTIYHSIPAFSLIDQDGKTVTDKDLEGKIYVANFFFATCKSICPKMSIQLGRVAFKFADNKDVMILSHTVNPEHDSVPVLKQYANEYKADPKKWLFLTGDKKQIYDLAQQGYMITAMTGGTEGFIHEDKFVLVDKEKHIRGYYDGTSVKDVKRLLEEMKVLLKEYEDKE